jgi:hypothetical protein
MIWFVIEAGVALLLAGFIVWFTMGGKRSAPPTAPDKPAATAPIEERDPG